MDTKIIEEVKSNQFIYLTTRGRKTGKPHTVELWFAFFKGKVYLSHEGAYTDWMKNIVESEMVSARIDGVKFDAKARIVGDGSPRELGKAALYQKYYGPASKEVIDDWFELSSVIELTPILP